jgi:hypothetical protein
MAIKFIDTLQYAQEIQIMESATTDTALSTFQPPTTLLSMDGQRITDVHDPVDDNDAANKGFVVDLVNSLEDLALVTDLPKLFVKASAVANITLATPGATMDGVSLTSGDRVLLTAQNTGSENGLWVWNGAAVAMTRPIDFAHGSTVLASRGMYVWVQAGTIRAGFDFYLATTAAITIDTTSQTWSVMPVAATNLTGVVPVVNGGSGGPVLPLVQVSAVAMAPVTLATPGAAIDVVTLSSGNLVLLTAQAAPAENGIWTWNGAAVAMSRPTIFGTGKIVPAGFSLLAIATGGATQGGAIFSLSTATAITVDTTSQTWAAVPVPRLLNGAPDPTTEGNNGDFYLASGSKKIFGPKASGTWPAGVALVGPAGSNGTNGSSLITGSAAPTTEGVNGDTYLQDVTGITTHGLTLYGPKAGGAWPVGVVIVAPVN